MNEKIDSEKHNAEKTCEERLKENAEKVNQTKEKKNQTFFICLLDTTSRRKMCTI